MTTLAIVTAESPQCPYPHHGPLPTECPTCYGPVACGPFVHAACRRCDPFQFARCGICLEKRIDCTC